ncbi:hypothetical protein WA1_37815 [Scytonema hofmannii PCC 7110]|uniref:Uncharacterized protein n=1 Tax=Scytonema hofmannii PCC 7110 TaxID=128403 RepID=A0A139X081_9CYAN|nr:hypothetical protein [Scytonema hofmannii]KYC38111.1 hypothetical protein WA1_37815 [Scytonema hofmannii PCC 7110]
MLLDEQKIKAFAQLIQSQPSLFSEQQQAQLWELFPGLPNDANKVANAIAEWSQDYQEVWNELLPLIAQNSDSITRGPLENPEPVNPKDYKEQIVNAMRESFPSPKQQPSPPPQSPLDSQQ